LLLLILESIAYPGFDPSGGSRRVISGILPSTPTGPFR